ncbi:GNAT family N-acetyltransferase [Sphingomonas sp. H39-1-10]|uniref:GNAT family N-acetyltransferase n=1 Tax=Sphingomonas pollutisoli TaxID=3030829 RepID=UPI0023B9A7E6|nr:GNAT family N-acetyltransferase [Sphingomonas pollutisoli]MDF0487371.1 GNAT family N-acetyltransferase [Sphingomonas pollutisoli]
MTTIRPVTEADADAITAIYAHHVLHGTGTFDIDPPGVAHWRHRIAEIRARGWPFLVAERAGRVLGYAYAAQFRDRAAYRAACEDSIYIAEEARGSGVGTVLLGALIAAAPAAGFREMVAVVGGPEPASVALHGKLGFREVGRLHDIGEKFGRSLDVLFLQRTL